MPLKKTTTKPTPLAIALAKEKQPRATPIDVFKLARKLYLQGKHISIGELAKKLNVSRGTVYRWVGSKDLLLDEIFCSLIKPTFEQAIAATPGQGVDHVVGVHRHFMTTLLSFPALQKFIQNETNYAFRILTNTNSAVSKLIVTMTADHLRQQEAQGHLHLSAPPEELAEFFILANQGLIYSNTISGGSPAIDKACALIRMLLSGRSPSAPDPNNE